MHLSHRFLLLTSLGLLLLIAAGLADTGSVITPIDQGQFYQGTQDECWNKEDLRRSTQTDFEVTIPPDIGSPTTPLYSAIGVHIEPHRGYEAFDYVPVALRNSLNAVAEGKINTFIATLHPGDFLELDDDEQDFQIWDGWLTGIVDPLGASGRLRWATVSEMAAAFTSWEESQTGAEPAPAPSLNAILISWDGTQREHLLELYHQGLLPNLKALEREGSMIPMEVRGHATDTKGGHAEILTGYGPEVTGVYSNRRYQAIPDGLTLFERLKARFGRSIATLAITGKRGNIIEILENALPELDFSLIRSADAERNGPVMLRTLENLKDRPFFAFFHFSDPDHAGHNHGENSREYSAAIQLCDHWLGEIVSKLRELGIYEKTLIYVTTDHGFDEGRKSHLHAPDIWFVTNDPLVTPPDGVATQGDIAPTILERFGFDLDQIEPPLPGRFLLSRSSKRLGSGSEVCRAEQR